MALMNPKMPQVFEDAPWTAAGGGVGVPYLAPAEQGPQVFASLPEDAAAAVPVAAGTGMKSAPPVFSAPEHPDVVPTPTPLQGQIAQTNQRLKALETQDATPFGSPTNHPGVGGKILHALSVAGNIAGDIFAPGATALLPGTQLNRQGREAGLSQRLQDLTQANDADQQSQAATAYTAQRPAIETARNTARQGIADDKNRTMLGKAGLKQDEDGNVSADEDSPVYQSRQVHDAVEQSRTQLTEAEEEVKRASLDPNSPAYRLAVSKANTARVNAGAAVQRAQAYYGTYLQHAYNRGLDGSTLAGSPQVEDEAGNVTTVGSTNAGQAVKAQQNVAMFNDVHGALDSVDNAARALAGSGGALNSPAIIYAMQHAHGTPSEFVQSLDKASLNPLERAFVIANQGAHENVQAMRKSSGGTATDAAVQKLDDLVPNGTTPDLNYLLSQTQQIRQTAERLGKGVTTVTGGTGVRGEHANQGATPHGQAAGPQSYKTTATGPNGHKIGSNDGGKTWVDAQTGKKVQ